MLCWTLGRDPLLGHYLWPLINRGKIIPRESIDMSNLTIFVKGFEYTVVAFVIGNRVHYKSIVRVGKVWHKFNPMSTDNSVILSWQEVKKLYSFNNILKDGVGSDCVECIFYLKKTVSL